MVEIHRIGTHRFHVFRVPLVSATPIEKHPVFVPPSGAPPKTPPSSLKMRKTRINPHELLFRVCWLSLLPCSPRTTTARKAWLPTPLTSELPNSRPSLNFVASPLHGG